jgi:hypothetical protein
LLPDRFDKAEVDYLVAAAKFIRFTPKITFIDAKRQTGWRIQAEVFKKSEPGKPIKGLVVMAKANQAPAPLPHPKPSAALEWYGKRIRGLNHEQWHDNPDGSIVKGWHEHIWSPRYQDSYVVEARPIPTRFGLENLFQWGLEKWNIEVLRKQGTFYDFE